MHILKQIVGYIIWALVAIIIAVVYITFRFTLNWKLSESSNGLDVIIRILYLMALEKVALIIGLVTTFIYILMDIFYLKKNLPTTTKKQLFAF